MLYIRSVLICPPIAGRHSGHAREIAFRIRLPRAVFTPILFRLVSRIRLPLGQNELSVRKTPQGAGEKEEERRKASEEDVEKH